jgi:hypothetical protein
MSFKTSFKNAAQALGRKKINGIEIRDLPFVRSLDRNSWREKAGTGLHLLASGAVTGHTIYNYGSAAPLYAQIPLGLSLGILYFLSKKSSEEEGRNPELDPATEAACARVGMELQKHLRAMGLEREITFSSLESAGQFDRGALHRPTLDKGEFHIALEYAYIQSMPADQIKALAAHEVGHNLDPSLSVGSMAIPLLAIASAAVALPSFALISYLALPAQWLIHKSFDRRCENFADHMGVVLTEDVKAYSEMLKDITARVMKGRYGSDRLSLFQKAGFNLGGYPTLSMRLRRVAATGRMLKRAAQQRQNAQPGVT